MGSFDPHVDSIKIYTAGLAGPWVFVFGFLWVFAKRQFRQNEVKKWVFGFLAFLGVLGGSRVKRFFVAKYFTLYSTSGRVDRVRHHDH
jgi:hypothetical protein